MKSPSPAPRMKTFVLALAVVCGAAPAFAQVPPARPAPPVRPAPPARPAPDVAPVPFDRAWIELTRAQMEELRAHSLEMARHADEFRIDTEALRWEAARMADMLPVREMEFAAREMAELAAARVADAAALRAFEFDARQFEEAIRGTVVDVPTPASLDGRFLNSRPRSSYAPQDPADSLYRTAREALNRGEYRRAAQTFNEIVTRHPRSRYFVDAGYWEAFARYRIGTTDELQLASQRLETIAPRATEVSSRDMDVAGLRGRIDAALARRGDRAAEQRVQRAAQQAGTGSCDREEQMVRVEALNALGQMDPASAVPLLTRVLERRDACSVELRKRAVFLLSRRADADAGPLLMNTARQDPDVSVRVEAITALQRVPGDAHLAGLEQILRSASEEQVQRAAIRTLTHSNSPRARQSMRALVENSAAPERLRIEAINGIAGSSSPGVTGRSVYVDAGVARTAPVVVTPTTPAAAAASAAVSAQAAASAGGGRTGTQPGTQTMDPQRAEDAAYLRSVYGRLETNSLKNAVINGVARIGGPDNEAWLLALARNQNEPSTLRSSAMSRMSRMNISIASIAALYDGADSRQMREMIISVLAIRTEPEATDKLIDIVRTGTDPNIRRQAINALSRKNDPRTTRLLMDLLERGS